MAWATCAPCRPEAGRAAPVACVHTLTVKHIEQQGRALAHAGSLRSCGGGSRQLSRAQSAPARSCTAGDGDCSPPPACITPGTYQTPECGAQPRAGCQGPDCQCEGCTLLRPDRREGDAAKLLLGAWSGSNVLVAGGWQLLIHAALPPSSACWWQHAAPQRQACARLHFHLCWLS